MLVGDAFLGLVLHKRRLHLPVDLGVGRDLLEERRKRIGQLLGVLHHQRATRLKGLVEHPQHLDPLRFVEVQEHVLAHDQAQPFAHRAKREQIAVRERDLGSQFRHDLDEAGPGSRPEVLLKDLLRDALDLRFGKDARSHLGGEARIDVGGMDVNVAEDVVGHPLAQQDGQRVGFRPVGASGVPDVNKRAAAETGQSVLDRQFKRLRVAEEKGEGHVLGASRSNRNSVEP